LRRYLVPHRDLADIRPYRPDQGSARV